MHNIVCYAWLVPNVRYNGHFVKLTRKLSFAKIVLHTLFID